MFRHTLAAVSFVALLVGALSFSTRASERSAADVWFDEHIGAVASLYRDLHQQPELSGRERRTAQRMADELKLAGAEVTPGVGRNGVVGVIWNGRGPTVLVRAEMDALPVTEATRLPYASTETALNDQGGRVGVMHACGHDIHMASLVGTVRWLSDHRAQWAGTVLFVAQPAEESGAGARWMLKDGLYTRYPRPDCALALHVAHDLEVGRVGYHVGPAMAGTNSVTIVVRGRGGHGALPHTTVDPIVLASALVLDLQTIVSREVNPLDPAVVTVGSIQGGSESNIIPESVRLKLTLRAFRPEVLHLLVDGVRRRALALAQGHGAPPPQVEVGGGVPPLVNDPQLVSRVVPALVRALGSANVTDVQAEMIAEDFGLFGDENVPTFMFRLGTVPPQVLSKARAGSESLPSLHSPQFAPDAVPALRTGIRAMTAAVTAILPPPRT
ncbi:MAG: amidohydrolase [Isosphaeraceae bacterium]|nr:amidohydrolase [Isosphaeraceae bacterium]